jgi:hypothetical protein
LAHRICTGLPRRKLGKLIEEPAGPWLAQQESRLRSRRGRDRLRAEAQAQTTSWRSPTG